MRMFGRIFLRHPKIILGRYNSTEAAATATVSEGNQNFETFRTKEAVTSSHSIQQIGKFYKIKPEIKRQIFAHGGIPKSYEQQMKTFAEDCLMVREPALEIMHYLKNTDWNQPAKRYVLYGADGTGKSLTMAHVMHYGQQQGFILVHVPWVADWFKKPKEVSPVSADGSVDLPLDAAAWLVHFKNQNSQLLSELNLKVSKDYVWSKRESTLAGQDLMELVEHGIARVKFASETITALLSELKIQSTAGKLKTMVAIDGFNAFFHQKTRIFGEHKVKITTNQILLTHPFVDITKYDWTHGAIILTVDKMAASKEDQESYLPRYLLGKEGFEHLDPFVAVRTENYNEKEFESCIQYYLDRRWIQNADEGFDKELKFLSGKNPYQLMTMCAPL